MQETDVERGGRGLGEAKKDGKVEPAEQSPVADLGA